MTTSIKQGHTMLLIMFKTIFLSLYNLIGRTVSPSYDINARGMNVIHAFSIKSKVARNGR